MIKVYKSGRVRLTGDDLTMLRLACVQRDRGRCRECDVRVSDALPDWHPLKYQMAHIKSRGAGGSDSIENVLTLCGEDHRAQHQGKKLKSIEEAKSAQNLQRGRGTSSGPPELLQDPI